MRPLVLLCALLLPLLATAQPTDLLVSLQPLRPPESGTSTTVQATLHNTASVAIKDVDVDVVLEAARATLRASHHPGWPADQWSCTTLSERHVRCRADIAPGPGQFIPLMLTIDPATEGRFRLTVQAHSTSGGVERTSAPVSEKLVLHREIAVTNTRDAGPGSLRAAIEDANGTCGRDEVPCAIRFAMEEPMPAAGWHTVRPATPLPAVTAPDIVIDGGRGGGTQPPVEIDGSLLTTGHGIELRGSGPAEIKGIAVGGFPWDAIAITRRNTAPARTLVFNSFIGVRPDQTRNGNGSRGITVDAPASSVSLHSLLISANARSGIFIAGATEVDVDNDFIGRGMMQGAEYANGASGIFVGPGSRDVEIRTGSIEGNAHFGVAVARGASGVRLRSTVRIVRNGILPLDHGLDGFSGTTRQGTNPLLAPPPAPRITSARYDAETNTTTITGTFDVPDPASTWTITLYNEAAAWPDLILPTVPVVGNTFTYTYPGRTFGPSFVSAYAESSDPNWSTSEFAEPVPLP